MAADAARVLEDLRGVGVLLARHVAGLLEQREVHERRGVALGARVAVPVPGAAEVAALLDDPDVVDAGLVQLGAGDQPGESAADEGDGDLVDQRLALGRLDVGILDVVLEDPGDLDVLLVAVGPQPLVAFLAVLASQCVAVDLGARSPCLHGTSSARRLRCQIAGSEPRRAGGATVDVVGRRTWETAAVLVAVGVVPGGVRRRMRGVHVRVRSVSTAPSSSASVQRSDAVEGPGGGHPRRRDVRRDPAP